MRLLITYQTLVVGGLGFLGVVTTLFWNARLQRRQYESEREASATALRRGLIEELRLLEEVLRGNVEQLGKAKQRNSEALMLPMGNATEFFDSSIDRLGLLDAHEVSTVLRAYLYIRTIPDKLIAWGDVKDLGGRRRFLELRDREFDLAQRVLDVSVTEVSKALAALEART